MSPGRLLSLILAALFLTGCAATVERRGLPSVQGIIHSSDPDGVNLDVRGKLYRIPGEQIREIDHPGNVVLVLGGVTFGFSAMMLGMMTLSDDGSDARLGYALAMSYAAMGTILAIAGGIPWAWSRSRSAGWDYRALTPDELTCVDGPFPEGKERKCR